MLELWAEMEEELNRGVVWRGFQAQPDEPVDLRDDDPVDDAADNHAQEGGSQDSGSSGKRSFDDISGPRPSTSCADNDTGKGPRMGKRNRQA